MPTVVKSQKSNGPRWLMELIGEAAAVRAGGVAVWEAGAWRMARARVKDAAGMSEAALAAATAAAYGQIIEAMERRPARYAVRFWNYIPEIGRVGDSGLDRYMVFNGGRFEACKTWLANGGSLPTASGVGIDGRDLIIEALGAEEAGVAIENPRQTPAYRYSQRFGPRPPCFARAMKVAGMLLVGGTASVRGEASVHEGDLEGQIAETLENLRSVVEAAFDGERREFSELRVYHPRRADGAAIGRRLKTAARVEMVVADLCRRELLVEMEGVVR